jgi:predicted dehydrogenase
MGGPGDRIPVGIVGGGHVGEAFLRQLGAEEDVRVVGIVTRSPARQAELRARHGLAAYGTVEALLGAADRPLVVCIVSANEDHAADAIAALRGGAHVYLEKPMASTLQECRAILDAERASGRHLQVGFEYMHGTMTERLKALVQEGWFGDLTWASVLDSRGHWWSLSPRADPKDLWKLDRRRGGGIIFHCGIHQLDMIRSLLGPIEEVTAWRPPRNALAFYPPDVPDNVTLMLRASSGAVCNFQVFHNRAPCYYREVPPFHPDWRSVPGHEFSVSLVGTRGSCLMQIYGEVLHLFQFDLERRDTVFERTESFGPNPPNKSHHDMHGLLMRFIRSVASGGGAMDPSTDALETMRLAFAAEDAIAKGGTVYLKDYR